MKKKEQRREPYIVPEKAKDKLNAAQKIRQTVYIYMELPAMEKQSWFKIV